MVILAKRIKELRVKYMQKSKLLLPLLGISKSIYQPINTYMAVENSIKLSDAYLIVEWDKEIKRVYLETLMNSPVYHSVFEQGNKVYTVFDMEDYRDDWEKFVLGRYSWLEQDTKQLIISYYSGSPEDIWIESYLYPEYYRPQYHRLLDVDMKILKYVGQLCDAPCIERETLKLR